MNTLKAEKRSMDVKAKKLRREGFVTGNVFGREMKESVPVQIAKPDLERLLKTSGKGSQIMLELDGQSLDVLIKEIQTDPLKGQPQEIDFQALVSNEKVHSTARVVLVNHEHVIDGILEQVLHEVTFKALPSDLVEQVLVDVGHMHVGDCIKVADLEIAKNPKIDLTTDLEAPVAVVSEFHKVAETEDADADADAAAEAAK